jgi:hypothetical protein
LKYWVKRKEVYVGLLDGVINVYKLNQNLDQITLNASFNIHSAPIHNLYILEDLKAIVSSGFDNCLNLWKPPEIWDKKLVITACLASGVNPRDNLDTIREENESYESTFRKRISAFDDFMNGNMHAAHPNYHSTLQVPGNQDEVFHGNFTKKQ